MMIKSTYLILYLVFSVVAHAQVERITISGSIRSDAIDLGNIHIINKDSNIGTITDDYGKFLILVKENDTLTFSGIQFKNKKIVISNFDVLSKTITISLISKVNQLDEVLLRKPKNIAMDLGLPNAGKKPLTKLEAREVYYSQASITFVILSTLLNKKGNIEDLYHVISGNRKRDRKLKALIEADKLIEYNQCVIKEIRSYFKDSFFITTLQIPEEKINYFIEYCIVKDILDLFIKDSHLDVMDILITESKLYLKELENEK